MRGKTTLYVEMLGKFVSGQRDAVSQIKSALANDDHGTAERLAHTLKGIAGNIGASALQSAAQAVEASIREGSSVESELDVLAGHLDAIVIALETSLPSTVAPPTQTVHAPLSDAETSEIIEKLRSLLEDNDADAEDFASHNAAALRSILPKQAADILRLISNFDFDKALALLPKDMSNTSETPSPSFPDQPVFPELDLDIFDPNQMGPLYKWNMSHLKTVITGFLSDASSKVEKLSTMPLDGDLSPIREIAHGLKGTSKTAGATRLGRLAGDLEDVAKAGDAKTSADLISLLTPTLAELETTLKTIFI
jgi:HPt (histidine-containing phosphotransfer) domain-containing protein